MDSRRFRVTGEIKLLDSAPADDWLPGATIAVSDLNAPIGEKWAGLELIVPPERFRNGNHSAVALGRRELGQRKQEEAFIRENDDMLSFEITFDDGSMTMSAEGTERRIDFEIAKTGVWLQCSSGKFEFSQLRIENLS